MLRLRMSRCAIAAFTALALATPALAAGKLSARWMAHCTANLKSENIKPTVVRKYCACMAGLPDEAEMLMWSHSRYRA